MKNRFLGFLVGLFCLLAYPALADTFIYCSEGSPDYFNPQLSVNGASFDASNLLYSRLVEFTTDGSRLKPGLAKRWTHSKDKKIYTFYLRKQVAFYSQGDFTPTRAFNADDVIFSFMRQKDKQHAYHKVNGGSYKFFYSLKLHKLIKEIKKLDEYTVQFVLNSSSNLFPTFMAMEFAAILSQEYADFLSAKKQSQKIDFEPVGTGPFILQKYVRSNLIRYKRNDNYYLGPAKLSKIIFSITPDPSVRFQKLKREECHFLAKPQPTDIPAMEKHKNIKLIKGESHNIAYLAFNNSKAPLDNPLVRKAIAHALNRELYIQAIYKNLAQVLNSPVPSSLWGHNPNIKAPEYDIEKSKALLKQAGFKEGLKLSLWTLPISRPYNPNGKKMGELMQADLKKVGIQLTLKTYDWPTYLAKSSKGEHQLVQMGWIADIPDPSNFLQILLSCDSIVAGSNLSRWCNKDYDKLITEALLENNQKKAGKLYQQAQALLAQEWPLLPLAESHRYIALSPRVTGYVLKPFGSERFYHLGLSKGLSKKSSKK